MCAAYDSPNFQDQLPGFAPRCSHDYGSAPGTDSQWKAQPAPPGDQWSGIPGIGVVARLPDTDGGETGVDTDQPNQRLTVGPGGREPWTGMSLDDFKPPGGDASSHVIGGPDHNPNSNGLPR